MNTVSFRTSVVGGYHKGDVEDYIESIEQELEKEKSERKKESADYKSRLEKAEEESSHLRYEMHQIEQEAEKKSLQEQKKLKDENQTLKEQLAAERRNIHKLKEIILKYQRIQEAQKKLQAQEQEPVFAKHQQEKYEEDCETISRVLESVRENARRMEEEVQKRRLELLAEAEREAKKRQQELESKMERELEAKALRLIAAKFKIEAYMKEIDNTQKKIYNLYVDMGKMAEQMPERLDQILEDTCHQVITEKKEEQAEEQED